MFSQQLGNQSKFVCVFRISIFFWHFTNNSQYKFIIINMYEHRLVDKWTVHGKTPSNGPQHNKIK